MSSFVDKPYSSSEAHEEQASFQEEEQLAVAVAGRTEESGLVAGNTT
jgi:hypothetical protein